MRDCIINTKLLPNQLGIFYLGQVGYILKYRDKYVLIDGYLSDYVDRNCCSEAVKWVRRYAPPMKPEDLDFIDFVFCTHAHFDHADPDTLAPLARVNKKAKFFMPRAISETVASYGVEKERIFGLSDGETAELCEGISATAIRAAHEVFHQNADGEYEEMGYRFAFGDVTLFHGGDGCPYEGLAEKLSGADILILPINGRDYYRTNVLDIIGCFDSGEALTIAKEVGADLLIPTHFDLYDVNCVNPAYFVDMQGKINPAQKYHIFMPGERYIYEK